MKRGSEACLLRDDIVASNFVVSPHGMRFRYLDFPHLKEY
jgi:hypothetical protein